MSRQINKEIAEEAAYREQEERDAIGWGVGLMIGGAAMGDRYSLRYLALCAEIARLNAQHSGRPTPEEAQLKKSESSVGGALRGEGARDET